ncbi:tyrosine-type recombinase/integrase [Burkholderia vietnamiensis]|uniref:tyrosine-type recombinase/integrase n=1 Tax=Burkholderia vietnamiensis TaxID=60552 RepID=UPI001CF519B5|nr:tyrosine-type recombinase/integrase [Burkholderia vietnamiensis]MCA8270357.1 tyrosine-type recombinase/integrase [Burkholderia vietnamiensis]
MPTDGNKRETYARYIGADHLAFFRGYLNGVELPTLARQYLLSDDDPRRAGTVLEWIRRELVAASHRTGNHGDARLLRLPPAALEQTTAAHAQLPTLEEFAEQFPPDYYSEAELIEEFNSQFRDALDRRIRERGQRAERLRRRMRLALERIEAQIAVAPDPTHAIAGWLDPVLAERLARAGLVTLDQLISFINTRGARFYLGIPRVGHVAATRIVSWLQAHSAELQRELSPLATNPKRAIAGELARRRPPASGIVPFEYLRTPTAIDGTLGRNRARLERNRTEATNDYQAIHAWLSVHSPGSHTWRAYRKEAERLLLWCIFDRGIALSDLDSTGLAAYQRFMRNPVPAARWIAPRHIDRFSDAWRPFSGPLSPSSIATATNILNSLFKWLVSQNYLDSNPLDGVPLQEPDVVEEETHRSLTVGQWTYVYAHATRASVRDQFAVLFAYATGLRRAEIAAATAGDLHRLPNNDDLMDRWVLRVVGKRKRARKVPMPAALMDLLDKYMKSRGYVDGPGNWPADAPLLARIEGDDRKPLTAGAIGIAFKTIFKRAAASLEREHPASAAQLARASAHWLRHTHGTHALREGASLEVVQANFGHQSIATTTLYVTAEYERRYDEIEAFVSRAMQLIDQDQAGR